MSKSIKAIKLSNKSEFRWQVAVNEYLSDKLASNSDDEKKMSRAERIAEKGKASLAVTSQFFFKTNELQSSTLV